MFVELSFLNARSFLSGCCRNHTNSHLHLPGLLLCPSNSLTQADPHPQCPPSRPSCPSSSWCTEAPSPLHLELTLTAPFLDIYYYLLPLRGCLRDLDDPCARGCTYIHHTSSQTTHRIQFHALSPHQLPAAGCHRSPGRVADMGPRIGVSTPAPSPQGPLLRAALPPSSPTAWGHARLHSCPTKPRSGPLIWAQFAADHQTSISPHPDTQPQCCPAIRLIQSLSRPLNS